MGAEPPDLLHQNHQNLLRRRSLAAEADLRLNTDTLRPAAELQGGSCDVTVVMATISAGEASVSAVFDVRRGLLSVVSCRPAAAVVFNGAALPSRHQAAAHLSQQSFENETKASASVEELTC